MEIDNSQWTPDMYGYLAWRVFDEIYDTVEFDRAGNKIIADFINQFDAKLTDSQRKIIDNYAVRLQDEYSASQLRWLEEIHWRELENEYYIRPSISYNSDYYKIWKQGAKQLLTVKMTYDSNSSGIRQRLVDPYSTKAPYVQGYCHLRRSVRVFRLDRVIDIELTKKQFTKKQDKKSQ